MTDQPGQPPTCRCGSDRFIVTSVIECAACGTSDPAVIGERVVAATANMRQAWADRKAAAENIVNGVHVDRVAALVAGQFPIDATQDEHRIADVVRKYGKKLEVQGYMPQFRRPAMLRRLEDEARRIRPHDGVTDKPCSCQECLERFGVLAAPALDSWTLSPEDDAKTLKLPPLEHAAFALEVMRKAAEQDGEE
jgi:hypothetical protein